MARSAAETDARADARARYARVILDTMYQFVALLDVAGNLLDVNQAALDGGGITLADVVGKPFWEIHWWTISTGTQERLQQAIRDAAAGEFVRYEVDVYGGAKGAEIITIDFSLNPVRDEDGRVVYLLPEGRNITEKKAAEALVAAKNEELRVLVEKLRELDELRSQLFANVSHELRTPLSLVMGPVQRHLGDAAIGGALRRDLEIVDRNARVLLRHVDDLLDVSKLEAGKMSVEHARTDLARLGGFVVGHFEVLAAAKRIQLAADLPDALPAEVDPAKIERVLFNLLSNAFKFTPDGGAVRVAVTRIGDRARLSVEDSGPGIPPAMREAVFERFRQVDGSVTRKHGGTGLGLAIVRELVVLHGGTVCVTDAALGGARFEVDLPLCAPEGSPVDDRAVERGSPSLEPVFAAVPPPQPASKGVVVGASAPVVVVADDNADMRAFVGQVLSPEFVVVMAEDGESALELVRRIRPDVVIADVMMPRRSGDELLAAIRSSPELAAIPVLLLTAKEDDALRVRLLRDGADDYLSKPFSPDELAARAHRLVADRARARVQLESQATLLRAVAEGITDAVFVKDRSGRYVFINPAGALGRDVDDILGKDDAEILGEEAARQLVAHDREVMSSGQVLTREELVQVSGMPRVFLATKAPYRDARGETIGVVGVARDITERKQGEELVRASLRAKETLLREIHHRVKNNLQIVSSLLSLQVRPGGDPRIGEIVEESQTRIRSIAMVHESLYRTESLEGVVFGDYLRELTRTLSDMFGLGARGIALSFDPGAAPLVFDLDRAVPCGLIVNELIMNAIKHAFPDGRRGSILVRIERQGTSTSFSVRDDGVGLPPAFSLASSGSTGVRIVTALARQLGAVLEVREGGGAGAELALRLPDGVSS